ncbi:complement C1q and tumor necrosis factor-related protein 9B-like isoform X1 [Anneissia japonica]|uniref:complement C1q and tumor necrosis factor-related protein 9B-like isoform X1 n=1 Tax=Anneissia japonica TaxID=1529436 RepID=UPI0014254F5D|nr:complement C1q and tumor necrosis factor-related protein 9B-like isoform X1 [Anneissia japonica]
MYLAIAIQLSIVCIIQSTTQTDTQDCSGCCSPAAGIPGIPGSHGTPGAPGPIGMKGDVGVKGDKGNQGIDGLQGKIGPIGLPGATGEKGETGEMGNQGSDGRDGLPGKIGPIGLPGATGEKGGKGEKGEQATTISQPKSAFSVAYNVNPGRPPVSPMKYPLIITNFGNHYNKETGKFVCQHPGIYVFQFTSGSTGVSNNILTSIMKNGQRILSAHESGSGYKSASNMVVLDLVANDEVWTEPLSTNHNNYFSNSIIYCSFSGFLLYASA